jgi:hypothetical protein
LGSAVSGQVNASATAPAATIDAAGPAAGATQTPTADATTPAAASTTAPPPATPTTEAAPPVVQRTTKAPAANAVSVEKQNAVRSAQSYLELMPFSRKGLIRQLSSDAGEGYTLEAATYAVDSLRIDFNAQAYKSAKSYLELMPFSRAGLIQQLESDAGEGFTHSQAVYGVTKAGL